MEIKRERGKKGGCSLAELFDVFSLFLSAASLTAWFCNVVSFDQARENGKSEISVTRREFSIPLLGVDAVREAWVPRMMEVTREEPRQNGFPVVSRYNTIFATLLLIFGTLSLLKGVALT